MTSVRRLQLGPDAVPTALLLWGPFVAGVLLWGLHSPDDAFITLRYARNLVHGHGPAFDPGERVEGFSSPLHLVVDAVVVALPGGHTLLKAKLASLACAVLALVASSRLLRRAALAAPVEAAGLLLVGGSWPLAMHSASGLETSLAAFVVMALLATLLADGASHPWRTGLLGVACVAVRPEGVAIVAAVAVAGLAVPGVAPPRARLRWAAVAAAGWAVLALGRLAWFGALVPNTVVAKSQAPTAAIGPGLRYLATAASPWLDATGVRHPLGVVVAGLVVALTAAGAVAASRSRRTLLPAAAAVVAQATVALVAGGDWMSGARLLVPVVPALVLLQVTGADAVASTLGRRHPGTTAPRARAALLAVLVVAAAATAATQPRLPAWHSGWAFDDRSLTVAGGYDGTYWAAAPALFRCARAGDLAAYSEMGYVAWALPELRFLDLHGLVTAEVARRSRPADRSTFGVAEPDWRHPHGPTVDEVLRRRPALLVIGGQDGRATVLGGRYRRVAALDDGRGGVVAYLRADRTCAEGPQG
ncbi:MAG: hypothetical protein U0P45_10645 [Acidimicrobiales bacterium]